MRTIVRPNTDSTLGVLPKIDEVNRNLTRKSASMATKVSVAWGTVFKQALLAGIISGLIFELYERFNAQWIASAAVGPAAFTDAAYGWLGLALHFIVSIGWAGGYAYFAQLQPFVNARWAISGLVYGVIVQMFMTLLLLGAHTFTFPATPNIFLNQLLAHAVFFGVPLAFVVAQLDKKA
jgi:hypothetical protein